MSLAFPRKVEFAVCLCRVYRLQLAICAPESRPGQNPHSAFLRAAAGMHAVDAISDLNLVACWQSFAQHSGRSIRQCILDGAGRHKGYLAFASLVAVSFVSNSNESLLSSSIDVVAPPARAFSYYRLAQVCEWPRTVNHYRGGLEGGP